LDVYRTQEPLLSSAVFQFEHHMHRSLLRLWIDSGDVVEVDGKSLGFDVAVAVAREVRCVTVVTASVSLRAQSDAAYGHTLGRRIGHKDGQDARGARTMVTSTAGVFMSQGELSAFAEKLESWSDGLTDKEQIFLAALIRRAAATEESQVQGFSFNFSDGLQCHGLTAALLISPLSLLNIQLHADSKNVSDGAAKGQASE